MVRSPNQENGAGFGQDISDRCVQDPIDIGAWRGRGNQILKPGKK